MKNLALVAAAAAILTVAGAAKADVTIHTTQFLDTVTNVNGFEGMGFTDSWVGPYTEGGITVDYVGTINAAGKGIWTFYQASEGQYSWYENSGGLGYTKITLADGGDFSAIELDVGSGWGQAQNFQYRLMNNGQVVSTGIAGQAPGHGFSLFGFSGATFDELDVQVAANYQQFTEGAYDAGDYDYIRIGTFSDPNAGGGVGGVPEPAAWALMLVGFGGLGAVLRRRRAAFGSVVA